MDSPSPAPSATPRQVSKSHFKAQALELFRQVEASGHPLVVTDHGRPMADPLEQLRGSVLRFDEPFEPVGENDGSPGLLVSAISGWEVAMLVNHPAVRLLPTPTCAACGERKHSARLCHHKLHCPCWRSR